MARSGIYRVEGARRLRQTMRAAGADLTQMRDANNEAARVVARAARAPQRSGALAASVRPGSSRTAAIVKAGSTRRGKVPYGSVIHWGWARRHIRAQPFLSEAATTTEPVWVEKYMKAVEDIINQIEGA